MSTAFVLGNGVSRQGIDLEQLRLQGKIYGCNALYREFVPDVLVATDRPISTAIQESGYALNNVFYTRRPLPNLGARSLITKYHGYSSGPNAVSLAATDQHRCIYMLGFDMGPIGTNGFNNIYADTEFYKTSQHPPTFTGNWIKQIIEICKDFPTTQFVRVSGPTTARMPELERLPNMKHLDMVEFTNQLLS